MKIETHIKKNGHIWGIEKSEKYVRIFDDAESAIKWLNDNSETRELCGRDKAIRWHRKYC